MPERKIRIPIWFILIAVLLNIIFRGSPQVAQYYVNYIFPLWVESYGRVTGLFPFSVGEMMIYLGVVLAAYEWAWPNCYGRWNKVWICRFCADAIYGTIK